MALYHFLKALIIAAILAAFAALSGCSFDPSSGASGNLDLETPFGTLKGDFKVVPGSIPAPYTTNPASPASVVPAATQPADSAPQ
jgi:hypothetical protein